MGKNGFLTMLLVWFFWGFEQIQGFIIDNLRVDCGVFNEYMMKGIVGMLVALEFRYELTWKQIVL